MLTLLVVLLVLASMEIVLLWLLGRAGALQRPVSTDDLSTVLAPSSAAAQPVDALEQACAAMRRIMQRVGSVDHPASARDAEELFRQVDAGRGALCGEMSRMFLFELRRLGITARQVLVARTLFDRFDQHSLIEVWSGDRWALLDPTFHLIYRDSDGHWLSAQQIKDLRFHGQRERVVAEFLGAVRYPCRREHYYVDPIELFTHVFVRVEGARGWWGRLPPFRFTHGPRVYFQRLVTESADPYRFWAGMYALTIGVLPVVSIVMATAVVGAMVGIADG